MFGLLSSGMRACAQCGHQRTATNASSIIVLFIPFIMRSRQINTLLSVMIDEVLNRNSAMLELLTREKQRRA